MWKERHKYSPLSFILRALFYFWIKRIHKGISAPSRVGNNRIANQDIACIVYRNITQYNLSKTEPVLTGNQ
jgi:hypothetical protein